MDNASDFVQRAHVPIDTSPVDRLIIHQFDPASPSPGGIDTCIRGLCKYAPSGIKLAIIGVDAGKGPSSRKLGIWEHYFVGGNEIKFLPVVKLDPSEQVNRRIPHSARLVAGLIRYRRRLPASESMQVHRADSAFVLHRVLKRSLIYFIHTQDDGITSKSSDSFWTKAASVHRYMESSAIRRASQNVVFNQDYSEKVSRINASTLFSPTWYDPSLIESKTSESSKHRIVWVGRLEKPKDPLLALEVMDELIRCEDGLPWELVIVGSGSLEAELNNRSEMLYAGAANRIERCGRLTPAQVAQKLASSRVFLMTSFPGYEGYPRVLVEAMATGLVPVVTDGSDTGRLIENGQNGYVADRSAKNIAARVKQALEIDQSHPKKAVSQLSAPSVVGRIFKGGS